MSDDARRKSGLNMKNMPRIHACQVGVSRGAADADLHPQLDVALRVHQGRRNLSGDL